MRDPNQGFLEDVSLEPVVERPRVDMRPWLAILVVVGIGALIAQQYELAGLTAIATLFAMAHAADLDPRRETAYRALAWIVPLGSAASFASLAYLVRAGLEPGSALGDASRDALELFGLRLNASRLTLAVAGFGTLISLATAYRPFANALARVLFREPGTRVLRLAARIAVIAVVFSIAGGFAFPAVMKQVEESGSSLIGGASSLWGNLLGLTFIALGAVGFLVRLSLRDTARRLGLTRIHLRDLLVIVLGLAAMLIVNAAAEWAQKTWFPTLWAGDQKVNQMIAGNLTRTETLLLGVSAGFGEEIALRGALQPRFGIFRTSMLFALLHVQYSWFGIAIIAVLGLLLGWIRRTTSTSAAIAVHTLYDLAAVVSLNS
jgi:Type II CAAX prenyl endopeptidase Rce1-like